MQFSFLIPTKVCFGSGCIAENGSEFAKWGTRALLVTGRNSAKASGALADVTSVLSSQGISWQVFDQIEENPTLETVASGGEVARQFAPTMVVAIGGGSPLDAAKAIAALATNPIGVQELFDGNFAISPLPILAVPLTAGTGSEVTPYSILTDAKRETKRSFSDPRLFPQVAFLDARYTQSQSRDVTVNTAIDALSHAIEGYVSRRATPLSDCLALEAMRYFSKAKEALGAGEFSLADREALLLASLLSGIVIAQTGTTAVHSLGYSLTYFRNVAHGRANGLLLGEFLRFNEPEIGEKVACILQALEVGTLEGLQTLLQSLLASDEVYTEEELQQFALMASQTRNMANTPRETSVQDLYRILRTSLPLVL